MTAFLIFSVLLVLAVLLSARFHRTLLSASVLFLVGGVAVGAFGVARVAVDSPGLAGLTRVALVTVLFTDAMGSNLGELRKAWRLPGRALLFGMPLTVVGLAVLGRAFYPGPLDERRSHRALARASCRSTLRASMTIQDLPLVEWVPDLVWVKEQQLSLMGGALRTRMTVLRLDQGLCVHSPVVIDDATRAELEKLGEVIALIAPSNCHHLYFASAQQAFPRARTFSTVDVQRKRKDLRFDEIIGDEPPACWTGQMEQVFIGNRVMREVEFLHRASRTLVAVDLVENFSDRTAGTNAVLRAMLRALGMWGRPRPAPELRWFTRDRETARKAIERILAWDFERAVIAHGDLLDRSAHEAIREAWRWVLRSAAE